MTTSIITGSGCIISTEWVEAFLSSERENGTPDNTLRRFGGALRSVYEFLPDDKLVTCERLVMWRGDMERRGYSPVTVRNYAKCINRYLEFVGFPELKFQKGRVKDLTGMTFGYLTAMEPTDKRARGDAVWLCRCRCGSMVEVPSSRLLSGNTSSCGCLRGENLLRVNKYYAGTSLTQSASERIDSKHSASGYVGVAPKKDKWQAYITYKGVHYSLGCYSDMADAVKARARAKALVIEDAQGLLDFYAELERLFPQPKKRHDGADALTSKQENAEARMPRTRAKRSDNRSGHTGVYFHSGRWEARISRQGVRYTLGRFDDIESAIAARKAAEAEF